MQLSSSNTLQLSFGNPAHLGLGNMAQRSLLPHITIFMILRISTTLLKKSRRRLFGFVALKE
jgi:hypothetical protein